MAETRNETELPEAVVEPRRRRRLPIVWIIPVIAALVAIGIAVQRIRSEGPTITIVLRSAEGIEAGKTTIKYKDVNIGQVRAVTLTPDFSKVEVVAKISKRAAGLMVQDAKFWVVRPSITLSGISGLNTLLSGNYIGFEAGKSEEEGSDFVALDTAPVNAGLDGREFILKAADLGSLAPGSPVYYRRLPAGQIISTALAADGRAVDVRVFINAPYDKYVTRGSRFWKSSGIDVALDANGLALRTESLLTLLVGGLVFDAPPGLPDDKPAPADAVFALFADRALAMKVPQPTSAHYVLHFDEPLRGLAVGAPVTFLGLVAGEVTAIALDFDAAQARVRPRVTVAFSPERLLAAGAAGPQAASGAPPGPAASAASAAAAASPAAWQRAFLRRQVEERGLRAQLRSGNLLTGQLFVAFEYFPRATREKLRWHGDGTELPVARGSLVDLESKVSGILDKIDRLPLEAIAADLRRDLQGLDGALADARKLIRSADTELVPSLKADLQGLQNLLKRVEKTLDNADATLLGPDAPAQQELRDALAEFTRAARSIRVLMDYLERHPESPIRGKAAAALGAK